MARTLLENPRRRRKTARRSRRKNPTAAAPTRRRRGRRSRRGRARKSSRRRNPFSTGGGSGVVALATQGVVIVAGMTGAEFGGAVLRRQVLSRIGMANTVPLWAATMVSGVLGAMLLRKFGLGRFARPFAVGGFVQGIKDIIAAKGLSGASLAVRSGLGDYMTADALNGQDDNYGVLGYNGGMELLGNGNGIGDYMTAGEPAWAN